MARRDPLEVGVVDSQVVVAAIERALAHREERAVVVVELERRGDPRTWSAEWEAIVAAAEARMVRVVRPDDILGRLHDDRFVVLTARDGAESVATRIGERLREPFNIGSDRVSVSPLLGVGYPAPGIETAEALIQAATSALRY